MHNRRGKIRSWPSPIQVYSDQTPFPSLWQKSTWRRQREHSWRDDADNRVAGDGLWTSETPISPSARLPRLATLTWCDDFSLVTSKGPACRRLRDWVLRVISSDKWQRRTIGWFPNSMTSSHTLYGISHKIAWHTILSHVLKHQEKITVITHESRPTHDIPNQRFYNGNTIANDINY